MEGQGQDTAQERQFDTDRARGLRYTIQNLGRWISPKAGTGEVLNHLLEEYPDSHPAVTFTRSFGQNEQDLLALVLDIANCSEIEEETGNNLHSAVMHGLNIVFESCQEDNMFMNGFLGNLAMDMSTGMHGKLHFAAVKKTELIDPFAHLVKED